MQLQYSDDDESNSIAIMIAMITKWDDDKSNSIAMIAMIAKWDNINTITKKRADAKRMENETLL